MSAATINMCPVCHSRKVSRKGWGLWWLLWPLPHLFMKRTYQCRERGCKAVWKV